MQVSRMIALPVVPQRDPPPFFKLFLSPLLFTAFLFCQGPWSSGHRDFASESLELGFTFVFLYSNLYVYILFCFLILLLSFFSRLVQKHPYLPFFFNPSAYTALLLTLSMLFIFIPFFVLKNSCC